MVQTKRINENSRFDQQHQGKIVIVKSHSTRIKNLQLLYKKRPASYLCRWTSIICLARKREREVHALRECHAVGGHDTNCDQRQQQAGRSAPHHYAFHIYSGVGIFNWYYLSSPPQILPFPRVPLERKGLILYIQV
jgi:hypothetical protein